MSVRLALLVVAVFAAACGPEVARPGADKRPEGPRYVFGVGADTVAAQPLVAAAKDLFKAHGVQVRITRFDTTVAAFRALEAGSVDAAVPPAVTPVDALVRGATNLAIVASTRLGQERFGAVIVSPDIYEAAQLRGRRIAVVQGVPPSHQWFDAFMRHHKVDGVEPRWLEQSVQVSAFRDRQLDAVFLWWPWTSRALEARPDARVLAWDSDIHYVDASVLVFGQRLMADRASAQAIVRALLDSEEAMKPEADGAKTLAAATGIPPGEAAELLKRVRFGLHLTDTAFAGLCAALRFARASSDLPARPEWTQGIAPDVLRAVAPQRVGYRAFIGCV